MHKHWGFRLDDSASEKLDDLLSRYADALEEAGDYKAALEEINNHKLFCGPCLICGDEWYTTDSSGSDLRNLFS